MKIFLFSNVRFCTTACVTAVAILSFVFQVHGNGTSISSAPSVSILSPVNNAAFEAGTPVSITASASPDIVKVEFFNGSLKIGEDRTRPFSVSFPYMGPGNYSVIAKGTDANGVTIVSSVRNFVVGGNAPPEIAVQYPGLSNVKILPGQSMVLGVVAEDDDGNISKVEFFINGSKVAEKTSAPYQTNWSTSIEGIYTFTAKATDNKRATTESRKVIIAVNDNKAPITYITSPSTGTTYNDRTNITIAAEASDEDGAIGKVEFYSAELKIGEDTTYPYLFTWSNVPDGQYSIWTHAIDNEGERGVSGRTYIIVKETNPNIRPSVAIVSPANGAVFNYPTSRIMVNIMAQDVDGTINKVELYKGTEKIGEDSIAPYSIPWENAPEGSHNIYALAVDNLGDVGYSSAIRVDVVDRMNIRPSVWITAPVYGSVLSAGVPFKITANAFDDKIVTKVIFMSGLIELGVDSIPPYTIIKTIETPGTYKVKAFAFDNQGAMGESGEVTVKIAKDNCIDLATYVENGGYQPGSRVMNIGNEYECKPFPNSGWCNSAAIAYAPGTGSHWTDAWILKGSCLSAVRTAQTEVLENQIHLTDGKSTLATFREPPQHVQVKVTDANGTTIYGTQFFDVNKNVDILLPVLPQGLYFLKVQTENEHVVKKYYVVK